MRALILFLALLEAGPARQPFYDRTHPSKVFGGPRNYRIFLPADYEAGKKAYPVIYYFHGHSDRYTLEKYDNGTDTVPKMAAYVAGHDLIVVAVDGYVARDYTGFYGGSPWDLLREGGDYDFGVYFQELVSHIDASYRTLTSRRHRGTSGLSMGGFMSLYLSARYPHLIGSASAFNPGPEFFTGDKGRRVLWRPKDHISNHTRSMVRLVRASGDYISQYHEETREAYARAGELDFEYRRDEYHRHWATSIAETFDFHLRAFQNPTLDNAPDVWGHASAYRSFEVWGWRVESAGNEPGFTCLDEVTQGGLRVTTRQWAPDGPPVADRIHTITTAALYSPGKTYTMLDHNLATGVTARQEVTADREGRISLKVDGAGHQVSFIGPGTGAQVPVLLPLTRKDKLRLPPGQEIALPIRIYNPRGEPMEGVRVALSSSYPTVQVVGGSVTVPRLAPGALADVSDRLKVRLTAGAGYFAPARLRLAMTYDGWQETARDVDVLVIPEALRAPLAVEILDGRTVTFQVFRQKGNQGGGASIERKVSEGRGNGNGILEPGEEATIWVKMAQGLDPFDKNNWYRAKIYSDSPWLTEVADIQEQKQLEWTGAKERTSLVRLSFETPPGTTVAVLLDNESWSYHYTPEVRYGKEKLYQAFQFHARHLHRYELKAPFARKLIPVDESGKDPSFQAFRQRALAALRNRDRAFLLSIIAPDIKFSFGGEEGAKAFRQRWNLDGPGSKIWSTLTTILELGGTFTSPDQFWAPYLHTKFPNDLDAYTSGVILSQSAPVRARPAQDSPVLETLSYDIVKMDYSGSVPEKDPADGYAWLKVQTPSGKPGFVAGRDIRSPLDHRACFERRAGGWILTVLVSGD